jgi:transcriptional regulator with PAS, ATPase and Fis domain
MPPAAALPGADQAVCDTAPAPVAVSPGERTRFGTLVQSPLRAALLRHLNAHRDQAFDIDALVQAFARLRVDIENCVEGLTAHGWVTRTAGTGAGARPRYAAVVPDDPAPRRLLEEFLSAPTSPASEDSSPALRRLRELIAVDETMLLVLESIRTVAKADISTLILGPTGAGKDVVARVIHELSRRGKHTFQAVSCAALPDSLFESEMFGYEKGAFTGAIDRKPGRMELANRGTLFLDEIGDLSLVAQAKLLRVLEDRRVERLGGRQGIDVDFRLVSATNRPLDAFVAERRFREDLYYRVNAFTVRLPALRERPADIPILAARFLASYCKSQGLPADAKVFSPGALDRMGGYPWPGNIREMVATVSRTALSSRDRLIQADDLQFLHPENGNASGLTPVHTGIPLHEVERDHIRKTLEAVSWNRRSAARVLEISRERLHRKIQAYNLSPGGHADERGEPRAVQS